MAKVQIKFDDSAMQKLQSVPELKSLLMETGDRVHQAATSSAQDAQRGPGGTLYGYAEAGFEVTWEQRNKRPRVVVQSLADPVMSLRVHFYTQKRDGVAHLRMALKEGTS